MQPLTGQNGYTREQILDALEAVTGSRHWTFRYELLDSTNTLVQELTNILEGSVEQNWLAEIKRKARFTLTDTGEIDFLSDRIKPWVQLGLPHLSETYDETVTALAGAVLRWKLDEPQYGPALNPNPFFNGAVGVSGWTASGGTIEPEIEVTFEGGGSLQLTPDGTSAVVQAIGTKVPVTVGDTYRASGRLFSPNGYSSVGIAVNWYDAALSLVSTSSNQTAIASGAWTPLANNVTAPASAAFAAVTVRMEGTPLTTDVLYADEVRLRAPTTTVIDASGNDRHGTLDTNLALGFPGVIHAGSSLDNTTVGASAAAAFYERGG